MFNYEVKAATERLDCAIQFRQIRGYWYPDLTVDRNAVALTKICFRPCKTEDEVLEQFANVAFCQFNEPALGLMS